MNLEMTEFDDDDRSAVATSKLTKLKKKLNANAWSDELETLMQSWGEKAAGNRELHDAASSKWKKFGEKLSLPVILLTTIGGVANFGAANSDDHELWMYAVGCINILAAAFASISKFYKPDEKAQHHSFIARNFGSFYRHMTIELGLSREDRMSSEELSRWAKNEYDRIQNEAPSVPGPIIAEYKKKHSSQRNLPDVASDSCEINIYGRDTTNEIISRI